MGSEIANCRICDFCGESTAILYCRADSAKLCLACDREVHATNQLFTKHTRWLLCDACGSSPVSIFCFTHNSVLCQNCDWEAHKPGPSSSGFHDRRPLDGFTGCPSVTELLGILGFEDVDKKALFLIGEDDGNEVNFVGYNGNYCNSGEGDFGFLDVVAWDCPSIVSVDELQGTNDSINGHNFQAMAIPPLPKRQNAVCGQHKDEILHQLREMSKSEPDSGGCDGCLDSLIEFETVEPRKKSQLKDKDGHLENNVELTLFPSHEVNAFQWCTNAGEGKSEGFPSNLVTSYLETSHLDPDKDSDVGDQSNQLGLKGQSDHPVVTENFHLLPKVSVHEMNSQERDSAISRYKEKKKTRRYEKHIRYESRKVRAESRTRIKGRFAKISQREPATR